MRIKLSLVILLITLLFISVHAQKLTETRLFTYSSRMINLDANNFIYDKKTGNFCYIDFDLNTSKYSIIYKDNSSEKYDYISGFDIKFDSKGNCFAFGVNYIDTALSDYVLIVNGEEASHFKYVQIYESFINKKDEFVFVYQQNDDYIIAKYTIEKGLRPSETYKFVKALRNYSYRIENEDIYSEELFTDKDGEKGFVVSNGNTASIILGEKIIETPYTDIESSSLTYDKSGTLCYIAKSNGHFYELNNAEFVVRGNVKFNEFYNVFPPVLFDSKNQPVYVISDSSEQKISQKVIVGNNVFKTYKDRKKKISGSEYFESISFLTISKDDEISFYANNSEPYFNGIDTLYLYYMCYVNNGIESEFLLNGSNWKFNKYGSSLYTYSTSKDNNAYNLILNQKGTTKKINSRNFNFYHDFGFINNTEKIYYIGVIYGNYEKKIKDKYYVYIDNKLIGIYEFVIFQQEGDDFISIRFDSKNNYTFIVQESRWNKANEIDEFFTYVISQKGKIIPQFKDGKKEFDYIQNLIFTNNNKIFYIGGIHSDLTNSETLYAVFNNIAFKETYNSIKYFENKKNHINFLASRGNEIYLVKIELQ